MNHFSRSQTCGPSPAAWIHGPGTAVFVPEGYERGYRYPLVCWLEDSRSPIPAACQWFPRASRRNCVAISLTAPATDPRRGPGVSWSNLDEADCWAALGYVAGSIAEVTAELSVHPDRIYLAGAGDGADMAVQLASLEADRFAGAIAVDPRWSATSRSCRGFGQSSPRRSLLIQTSSETACQGGASIRLKAFSQTCTTTDIDAAAKKLMNWLLRSIPTLCHETVSSLVEISAD